MNGKSLEKGPGGTVRIVSANGKEVPPDVRKSAESLAAVIAWMSRQKDMRAKKPVKAYTTKNCSSKEMSDKMKTIIEVMTPPGVMSVRDYMLSMNADYELDVMSYSFLTVEEVYFANLVFKNEALRRDVIVTMTGSGEAFPGNIEDMQRFLPWYDCSGDCCYGNPAIGIVICDDMASPGVAYVFSDREDPLHSPVYRSTADLPEEFRPVLPDAEKLLSLPGLGGIAIPG
ncbi:MAG: hypothetical protein LUE27_01350 [Clostridia bacterium]|nr:hypothetical protein [Clostridia bacterium]